MHFSHPFYGPVFLTCMRRQNCFKFFFFLNGSVFNGHKLKKQNLDPFTDRHQQRQTDPIDCSAIHSYMHVFFPAKTTELPNGVS